MKIGLLLPSVYMGSKYKNKIFAPRELFINLANGLVEKGHEVYVYSSGDTKTKAALIAGDNILVKKDLISPKFRGLDQVTKKKSAHVVTRTEYETDLTVKAYIHARKNKLKIMHTYHNDAFIGHYINRILKFPTIYTIHDPRPLREHIEYWRFNNFKNDNYIFISQSQLRDYKKMLHSVGVVYHGVNIKKFAYEKGEEGYLALLGRYIKEKGVYEAIFASKKANKPLKMVGDDAYRVLPYFQEKIKPYLKKDVIEDKTFFGEDDRSRFLGSAKALLFPILWEEPFGMVMIEAMACGTPVIAYNRGSVSEIIKDGLTGFIIDQKEHKRPNRGRWVIKKMGIEGLVEAIKRIYDMDDGEYQKIRENCRKHVEENFTIEKMVDGYEKVYKKIAGI